MTGAPGSKWSAVSRTIYWSNDIDHSDYSENRKYHMESQSIPSHMGAYWDPGMEFGIERDEWDKPFSGDGYRIIKAHTFAHNLENLKTLGYPIVLVYRNDYECVKQWFDMGGFNITYPNYKPYYKNPENMWKQIIKQNRDIMDFIQNNKNRITRLENNYDLCKFLNISTNGLQPIDEAQTQNAFYDYKHRDVIVYVYK
jgi:hypothetical protein